MGCVGSLVVVSIQRVECITILLPDGFIKSCDEIQPKSNRLLGQGIRGKLFCEMERGIVWIEWDIDIWFVFG